MPPRIKVPAPVLVRLSDEPAMIPPYVRVVPEATSIVPLPVESVIPRFDDIVNVAVVLSVPPPNVIDAAVTLPGVAPRFASEPTDTVPPEIVTPPVCELEPDNVRVPLPFLIRVPELALVVPLNSVDELSPPDVKLADNVIEPAPAIEPTVSAFELRLNVAPDATERAVVSGNTPAAPSFSVPASIAVAPVNVFVPESVNVPDPEFVTVETGVAIGSETVTLPLPMKEIVGVPEDAPNADPLATSNVNVPSSLPIDALAASVTTPVIEFVSAPAVDTLRIAPVDEIPVPDTVKGSAIDSPVPETFTTPPELTVVPADEAPKAPFEDTTTVEPFETVVKPVYVFVPDNVNVPEPEAVNVPEPVAIGSATVTFPFPENVRAGFVPASAPKAFTPDPTSNVNGPPSLMIAIV